jgi:hypothetical protein
MLIIITVLLELIFFERTTLDECVSIDIIEKYKIISLEGHNQVKQIRTTTPAGWIVISVSGERTQRKPLRLVGLGYQCKPHNASPRDAAPTNIRAHVIAETCSVTLR